MDAFENCELQIHRKIWHVVKHLDARSEIDADNVRTQVPEVAV